MSKHVIVLTQRDIKLKNCYLRGFLYLISLSHKYAIRVKPAKTIRHLEVKF